jgi:hypothetical protein
MALHRPDVTQAERTAFNIISRAEHAYLTSGFRGDVASAALFAISQHPESLDAHRLLSLVLAQEHAIVDNYTLLSTLRESFFYLRPYLIPLLQLPPAERSAHPQIHALVRFITSCTSPLVKSLIYEHPEIMILVLEEALRIDHEDHLNVREQLVLAYLQMVGRRRRRHLVPINRDLSHVNAILNCHFSDSKWPLFDREPSTRDWYNEDLMVLRWTDMIILYHAGDDRWKSLAIAEEKICPRLFQEFMDHEFGVIFPRAGDDKVQENAGRLCYKLMGILEDWPDFMTDMHWLLRGKLNPEFMDRAAKIPRYFSEIARERKHELAGYCEQFLNKGRAELLKPNYNEALHLFSQGRRCYGDLIRPTNRFYLNGAFELVSNRALTAERMGSWNLSRHDTRETLQMKHDHWRSYERLPLLAEKMQAPALRAELAEFVQELKSHRPESEGQCAAAAKKAIAMLSVTVMMESKKGTLTEERRKEMLRVGIDDCYTSLSFGKDVLPPLPWVADEDLEWD